jgi:O-antigen ligase
MRTSGMTAEDGTRGRGINLGKAVPPKARMPLFGVIAVVLIAAADSTRRIGIQGELTVALAGLGLVLLPVALKRIYSRQSYRDRKTPRVDRVSPPLALWLFGFWILVSLVLVPPAPEGFQNVIVYELFVMTVPLVAAGTLRETPLKIMRGYRGAGVFLALIYLGLVGLYGPGVDSLFTARQAGGSMLVAFSPTVAMIAILKEKRWPLGLLFLGLGLSLSRGSLAVSLIIALGLAAHGKRRTTLLKIFALAITAAAAVVFAYQNFAPFRNRFQEGDGYSVDGFTVGSSGRSLLWSTTYQHWQESPWLGHGAGSAQELIMRVLPPNAHPHNDHLRLLHDFGIVGYGLWVLAIVTLIMGCWRRYRSADLLEDKCVHFAAMLSLVSLNLTMVVDNPVVTIFIMIPVAALVGVSLGRGTATSREPSPAVS